VLNELRVALSKKERLEVLYVGSRKGPERSYAQEWGLDYASIPVGKWRRYRDWRNLTDLVKVGLGVLKSLWVVARFRPEVIFSKGGYVSVPVLLAGWVLRVPIVIHDSDGIPGLTTRIAARLATVICLGEASAAARLPASAQSKVVVTGTPVRPEILKGSVKRGRELTGFEAGKPVVLVMGGSLGAARLNRAVQFALKKWGRMVNVVHLTGRGKKEAATRSSHYLPLEFVGEELADLYKLADVVVSRAGANSLAEIQSLGLPSILVPLGRGVSHGDQEVNALSMVARGGSVMIPDEELNGARLSKEVRTLMEAGPRKWSAMGKKAKTGLHKKAAGEIARLICGV